MYLGARSSDTNAPDRSSTTGCARRSCRLACASSSTAAMPSKPWSARSWSWQGSSSRRKRRSNSWPLTVFCKGTPTGSSLPDPLALISSVPRSGNAKPSTPRISAPSSATDSRATFPRYATQVALYQHFLKQAQPRPRHLRKRQHVRGSSPRSAVRRWARRRSDRPRPGDHRRHPRRRSPAALHRRSGKLPVPHLPAP